jgi:ADP-ribose pyrophosphatase YjhB (NUDIX family)
MGVLKIAYSPKGIVHFSVGAIIKKEEKFLLIERAVPPEGFACPAGHIEMNETPEQALIREIKEETSLVILGCNLLFEETLYNNWCKKGVTNHHWYIFECNTSGLERKNKESKSIGWFSQKEIKTLNLEPTWQHFFKKMNII